MRPESFFCRRRHLWISSNVLWTIIPRNTGKLSDALAFSDGHSTNQDASGSERNDVIFDSCEVPPVTTHDSLTHKPIFVMHWRRNLRTRDKRFALIVLLPTRTLDSENWISVVLENDTSVVFTFRWSGMLLKLRTLVNHILSNSFQHWPNWRHSIRTGYHGLP